LVVTTTVVYLPIFSCAKVKSKKSPVMLGGYKYLWGWGLFVKPAGSVGFFFQKNWIGRLFLFWKVPLKIENRKALRSSSLHCIVWFCWFPTMTKIKYTKYPMPTLKKLIHTNIQNFHTLVIPWMIPLCIDISFGFRFLGFNYKHTSITLVSLVFLTILHYHPT